MDDVIIRYFGATWCGPCKKIDPLIMQWYEKLNYEKITRIVLDIDENIDQEQHLKAGGDYHLPAVPRQDRGGGGGHSAEASK